MKRKLKIDYDGRWYELCEWTVTGYSLFRWEGRWRVLSTFRNYEDAHKAAIEVLGFPKYFESEE